ncbi:MAG: hypothetical protein AAF480_19265, partial [Actinomycetota bacterium]
MGGTVVIIILLAAVVPVMIIMSGLAASAALGFVLKKDDRPRPNVYSSLNDCLKSVQYVRACIKVTYSGPVYSHTVSG